MTTAAPSLAVPAGPAAEAATSAGAALSGGGVLVIVPAYNAAAYLEATLASVAAQDDSAWRCVVVDDGSTDATADVARAWAARDPRFVYLHGGPNGGLAHARNTGYERFRGGPEPYVIFLDSDDVWTPGALRGLRGRLDASPGDVVAFGASYAIDGKGDYFYDKDIEERGGKTIEMRDRRLCDVGGYESIGFEQMSLRNSIMTPGLALVRKSALEHLLARDGVLFDAKFPGCEDWELWIRLTPLGQFGYVDARVIGYRRHGTNMSKNRGKMARAARGLRLKVVFGDGYSAQQRRYAYHAYLCWWGFLARDRVRWAARAARRRDVKNTFMELAMSGVNVVDGLSLRARWLSAGRGRGR